MGLLRCVCMSCGWDGEGRRADGSEGVECGGRKTGDGAFVRVYHTEYVPVSLHPLPSSLLYSFFFFRTDPRLVRSIVSLKESGKIQAGDRAVPVQVLFCLKEKNQKKINSHRCVFFLSRFVASFLVLTSRLFAPYRPTAPCSPHASTLDTR